MEIPNTGEPNTKNHEPKKLKRYERNTIFKTRDRLVKRVEEINSRELQNFSVQVHCQFSISDKSGNLLDAIDTVANEKNEYNSKNFNVINLFVEIVYEAFYIIRTF